MTCDECGAELHVGDYPFCPHGSGSQAVAQDEIPGGMWVENGFPQPIKVYSHSEHRRLLAERGLEIRAKYCGDADKHLTNWAAGIDRATLDNAAVLVSRRKSTPFATPEELAEFPITVTNIRFEKGTP